MFRPNPLSLAVSIALIGGAVNTQAAADAASETVQITGIRASLQKSIEAKKNAATNVEVVTAEDVGKMPDKNIADALSRVAGVNVQYGGALAMDEAERIAIRGSSPNLNLVTVNSHALSSGDWHVGDQGSSGRSVGFGLMPSQLIGQSIVYKTSQADITEGGISGTVDIRTRKPLDFSKPLTGELSLGLVYADLPKKTDPQVSGLVAWKNDSNTLGVMLQAFREDRHLRRDGQETFSFGNVQGHVVTAAEATASGNAALAGKRIVPSLNSALFEGVRERQGGYLGVQWKPTPAVNLNASIFHATLRADNYNSSAYAVPATLVKNGWLIRDAVIDGDVITSASLVRPANAPASQRLVGFQFDHNQREGAESLSSFYDLEGKFKATDSLTLSARAGYTKGEGVTNTQPSLTFGLINPNMRFQINGSRPTDYTMLKADGTPIDLSTPASYAQLSNTGAAVESKDKEHYFHFDSEYATGWDKLTKIKVGARNAKHTRTYDVVAPRWKAQDGPNGPLSPSPFVSVTGGLLVTNIVAPGDLPAPATAYPGNYASGLNADFPRNLFRYDPAQIKAFNDKYVYWDPVKGKTWTSGYKVEEENNAIYAMSDFEHGNLSGNFGVRGVETKVTSTSYQALPNNTSPGGCVILQPCSVPGAIVGSYFATYVPQVVETSHKVALPSLNVRWDLDRGLIARFGANKSLGRPNYNELAGNVSLNNTLLTGSTGNPNLKPTISTNFDASLGYYFGKRAYVYGALFHQGMKDYVKFGTTKVTFFNTSTGTDSEYTVSTRFGTKAKAKGMELAGEYPIGAGFGVGANATYVDAKDVDGVELLGTSQLTYNLIGFYESDAGLTVRAAWNHRSDYAIGFVGDGSGRPAVNAAGVITAYNGLHKYKAAGSLSMSIGYKINPNMTVTLDGNNLNNPVRHTYFITENAPGYWHQSGRQYFLNLRMKY